MTSISSAPGTTNSARELSWRSVAERGTFNDTTGELTYKDCKRVTTTLDEADGPEQEEVHYTNGSGIFIYKNGELSWHADNDPDVNECVFAR